MYNKSNVGTHSIDTFVSREYTVLHNIVIKNVIFLAIFVLNIFWIYERIDFLSHK